MWSLGDNAGVCINSYYFCNCQSMRLYTTHVEMTILFLFDDLCTSFDNRTYSQLILFNLSFYKYFKTPYWSKHSIKLVLEIMNWNVERILFLKKLNKNQWLIFRDISDTYGVLKASALSTILVWLTSLQQIL